VVAMQSDNAGRIWYENDKNATEKVEDGSDDSDETCWLSVRSASRVTPKVLMLSEKRIWEPAIVGVENKGKL